MIERETMPAPHAIATGMNVGALVNQFENQLRPKTLEDFTGQGEIKKNLQVAMKAAQKRQEPLDHVLFHGSPGLGKTTLANIIAKEMKVSLKVTSGPALERQGDLAAILSNLKDNDILFIDEIHRLRPPVEEILYTAMEDFGIDIVIGKGPSARSMRINLPKFTLVGATTRVSALSAPLRGRFGNLFKLQPYTLTDLQAIILRNAKTLEMDLHDEGALLLAKCARSTPRIAIRLLKRIRDFADIRDEVDLIDASFVETSLRQLGIDPLGLNDIDRDLIRTIMEKFEGGPVGLSTISAALNEEQATIEDIYEPYLIQLGFLERTPRGRMVTRRGCEHLGFTYIEKE